MKRIILLLIAAVGISLHIHAQSLISAGIGYFGEKTVHPGVVLEFEYETFHSESFSLPLRIDLGYFSDPDYNLMFIDIHKGFRKYFTSGLFVEQSIGLGIASSFYTLESIYYVDDFQGVVRYRDGGNLGFTPSITLGAGYNLTRNQEAQNLIWIRPKIYWNFGVRGLNLPYAALQIGYTHTFKTRK